MYEIDYLMGKKAAWRDMLRLSLLELGASPADQEGRFARLFLEKADAISMLRQVCEKFGDNDWDDNLYLSDIIEKHLWRNLEGALKDAHREQDTGRKD